jgi:xanthine dehydrogenase iron-sulfur cluster and FAD-binding subunit A
MGDRFEFTLNGKQTTVAVEGTNRTLLHHLRSLGLTGSKEGCGEGDCGACTALLVDTDHAGRRTLRAINTCITLLPMVAGRELVTVEGIAQDKALHPVQRAMVARYGSQCGYCTPGFVASMVEGFQRPDVSSPETVADQLQGNLCRCTGYRPIRDAMADALACRGEAPHDLVRISKGTERHELRYEARGQTFLRPTSLDELLRLRARHAGAVLVAGATEIGVDITKKGKRYPFLISTEGVAELAAITATAEGFRVGGAATPSVEIRKG